MTKHKPIKIGILLLVFLLIFTNTPIVGAEITQNEGTTDEETSTKKKPLIEKEETLTEKIRTDEKMNNQSTNDETEDKTTNNNENKKVTKQNQSRTLSSTSIEPTPEHYFQTEIIQDEHQNEAIKITGYSKNGPKDVVIPETIDGKIVTSIGEYAFSYNGLTSVEFPDSLTSIGDSAFYYNALTSVEFPNTLTSIDDWAFYYNALTSVEFPDSLTSIGNYAFRFNELTSIKLPDSLTSISVEAFS